MTPRALRITVLALLAVPSVAVAQPAPSHSPTRYVTRPGDTCVGIARSVYRDGRMTVLIHRANPFMGPPPHRLRPGTVLTLPPRDAVASAPDATLTAVHNAVELRAPAPPQTPAPAPPAPRPGRPNDPLYRGTRVHTQERSSAEVTFADETQLQLAERTLIVILGETSQRVQRDASARDTVLERGTLTAFLANADRQRGPAPSTAVRTEAARVTFDRGTEARLEVDDRSRATLAVYQGRSQVSAPRQRVPVPRGYGVRAVRGRPIPPPRLLPLAPVWQSRPPALVLTDEPSATLVAEVHAGVATPNARGELPPTPAQWHIEVARDARFGELLADLRGPAQRDRIEVPGVEPGRYFFRVSALDAEGFRGPSSEALQVTVRTVAVRPDPASRARDVVVGAGLFCALDGAPLAETTDAPIAVERRHAHTLRCATSADARDAVERRFDPEPYAPLHLTAALSNADGAARTGTVRVSVRDASNAPVTDATPRFEAVDPALHVGDAVAVEGAPGEWTFPVTWTERPSTTAFRVSVDEVRADTDPLALPDAPPPPPPPPPPPETFVHRLALHVDGLGAAMLSDYQRNDDRSAAEDQFSAPALSWGYGGGVRAGLQIVRPDGGWRGPSLAVEAGAAYVRFPTGASTTLSQSAAAFTTLGAGLRIEPFAGRWRLWADAHANLAFTGSLLRSAFDVGVGIDVPLGARAGLGPFVRYVHLVEPGTTATEEDAKTLLVGLSLTLRAPSPRW